MATEFRLVSQMAGKPIATHCQSLIYDVRLKLNLLFSPLWGHWVDYCYFALLGNTTAILSKYKCNYLFVCRAKTYTGISCSTVYRWIHINAVCCALDTRVANGSGVWRLLETYLQHIWYEQIVEDPRQTLLISVNKQESCNTASWAPLQASERLGTPVKLGNKNSKLEDAGDYFRLLLWFAF